LKPEDIAYSIQRGLLQDRTDGPQWVLLQPIFGVTSIAELAAKEAGLKETPEKIEQIPAEGLVKACQRVQKAVTYDNDKGTVTITLNAPFGPILQILAQPWGAALSKEWVIKQGGWDGTCD